MKRRVRSELPPHDEFVRVWLKSSSLQEVVAAFGGSMSIPQVRSRANYLRRLGVALKRFEPGRPHIDVGYLNDIIKGSIA